MKAELKRRDKVPTPGQETYLLALARAGVETYLWRPGDWPESPHRYRPLVENTDYLKRHGSADWP